MTVRTPCERQKSTSSVSSSSTETFSSPAFATSSRIIAILCSASNSAPFFALVAATATISWSYSLAARVIRSK